MKEVTETLKAQVSPRVCVTYLETATFAMQRALFNRAKIVVAAHGAALVNVAFMKECSLLVELFPWQLWRHSMYQALAHDVGVVYSSVMDPTGERQCAMHAQLWPFPNVRR